MDRTIIKRRKATPSIESQLHNLWEKVAFYKGLKTKMEDDFPHPPQPSQVEQYAEISSHIDSLYDRIDELEQLQQQTSNQQPSNQ